MCSLISTNVQGGVSLWRLGAVGRAGEGGAGAQGLPGVISASVLRGVPADAPPASMWEMPQRPPHPWPQEPLAQVPFGCGTLGFHTDFQTISPPAPA